MQAPPSGVARAWRLRHIGGMTAPRRPSMRLRRLPRPAGSAAASASAAAAAAAAALTLLAGPSAAGDAAPQVICTVAPEAQADVQPAARDQVCAALAQVLAAAPAARAPGSGLVVTLHLTQADGRRLAGWIEWVDAGSGHGRSQPAAAMLPDRPAAAALPQAMLTRFLSLSLRAADFPG